MRRLTLILLLLLVLVAGLFLGPRLAEYQGYVLLVMEHGTVQMSILGLLLSLAIGFIALMLVGWFLRFVWRLFSGSQTWLWSLSSRRRNKAFRAALIHMAEGDHSQAMKMLNRIQDEDFDGINLLAQAELHLRLDNPEAAVTLWERASLFDKAKVAAKLNLMRHFLKVNHPEKTLSLIEELTDKERKNKLVVALWAQALAESDKWKELNQQLPRWRKLLGKEKYAFWQQRLARGRFAEIASKSGAKELMQDWANQSRSVRKDPAQQAAYVQQLIDQGMHIEAEKALVDFQSTTTRPVLLQLFNQLVLSNPIASVKFLENRIKMDSNNGQLYSVLGHVAFNAKNYGLAERALKKAIHLSNQQEDVLLLAQISEIQQNNQQALQLYKQGLVG